MPEHADSSETTPLKKVDNPIKIGDLAAGDLIVFENGNELHKFEDLVAAQVNPTYKHDVWAGRLKLIDLVKPPKFHGSVRNIVLAVMGDPYERLLDANQRGWTLNKGGSFERLTDAAKATIEKHHGFTLTADAYSTGKGVIGQIQTELWYRPIYPTEFPRNVDFHGRTISRIVAKPKLLPRHPEGPVEAARRFRFTDIQK